MLLTYSSLISAADSGASRLQQLVDWCKPNFEGLIVFDGVPRSFSTASSDTQHAPWRNCVKSLSTTAVVSTPRMRQMGRIVQSSLKCALPQSATRPRTWCPRAAASQPRWARRCCSCSACSRLHASSTAPPQVRRC